MDSLLQRELSGELPAHIRKAMDEARSEGQRLGHWGQTPDFDDIMFAAAWNWLHWFRGAGKESAYGPLQQMINDDANSHAFRGFVVGWLMSKAYHEGIHQPV